MLKKSKKFIAGVATMSIIATMAMPAGVLAIVPKSVSVYAETSVSSGDTKTVEKTQKEEPTTVAEKITSQGKCGDNAIYKYDSNTHTITVSGTGDMWDDYGFAKVLKSAKKIVIENGIQSVGAYSFQSLNNVTEISIAESVKTIKTGAFPGVEGTVEIPKSVTTVETNAFVGAKKYVIKGDVTGYDVSALGYYYIDEVVIYGAAQDLGMAVYGAGAQTITIAQENTKCKVAGGCLLSSDGKQLYYCINSRGNVLIPDSVETIARAAFCNKSIREVTLGKNVKQIGDYAFGLVRVKKINVNKKLKNIGTRAFYGTNLSDVSFAGKVKLGIDAFNEKVKIKYLKKFKTSQTTVSTATVGKVKYNIRYAKVSGAKGYQIKVKMGKKTYQYFTSKNYYNKKAPKAITKDYRVTKEYNLGEMSENPSGAAYVTVRPYKVVKKKKSYGRWSEKIVLNYGN